MDRTYMFIQGSVRKSYAFILLSSNCSEWVFIIQVPMVQYHYIWVNGYNVSII